ncbi:MAG: hypothetical protein JWO96_849 [Candidatus Saccharibacteria bacterium]|nr:hypothetical protein [Candidatus Saccharibacteria bacterium]
MERPYRESNHLTPSELSDDTIRLILAREGSKIDYTIGIFESIDVGLVDGHVFIDEDGDIAGVVPTGKGQNLDQQEQRDRELNGLTYKGTINRVDAMRMREHLEAIRAGLEAQQALES